MQNLLLIFCGGGAGAVSRYFVGLWAARQWGPDFPYGTLLVNALGALAIGMLAAWFGIKVTAPASLRLLLVTGFLGGFTTFSAFSLETALMLERGDIRAAAFYIAASVGLTVAFVMLGGWLVRQMLPAG